MEIKGVDVTMPRIAREKSISGIYHVILRGANRQEIFHDDKDRIRFLETLVRYKSESEIKLHGWCLMNNHIHMLIEEGKEEIAATMKRLGVSFVRYYNWKYNTTGHLFQDRYKSEKVDSDRYFLTVIRYIHRNPVNAGLAQHPSGWKWSSCREYYGEKSYPAGLLNTEAILELFSQDKDIAVEKFKEFCKTENEDTCLEDNQRTRLKDEEVKEEIENILSGVNVAQIKSLPKKQRDEIVKSVKTIKGVSQRQLARVMGISQTLISSA